MLSDAERDCPISPIVAIISVVGDQQFRAGITAGLVAALVCAAPTGSIDEVARARFIPLDGR